MYDRPADGVFRLEGRGYGHGHGMSQFGAEGAARKGLTAREILAFYYPGTTIAQAPATQTMRINLSQGVRPTATGPDIRVRPAAGLQVSQGSTVRVLPTTLAGKKVTVWRTRLSGGALGLYGWTGAAYEPLTGWTGQPGPFRFTTAPDASTTSRVTLLRNGGGEVVYRGVLEARRSAARDKLRAISAVLVDDYVKSVVSAEVPAGWSTAAYQAQAVAARSYGLFKRTAAVAAGSAWHICDSTTCQVYNGYSGETSAEAKAATATAGQYLSYGGAPDLRRVQLGQRRLELRRWQALPGGQGRPLRRRRDGHGQLGSPLDEGRRCGDRPGRLSRAGLPSAHRGRRPGRTRRLGRAGHQGAPRGLEG